MALRTNYQSTIERNTLYEIQKLPKGEEQLEPSIEVNGGIGDIYVTQIDPSAGTLPAGMNIITNGDDLEGVASWRYLPNYLYVEAATDVTIVISGFRATEVL